MSLRYEVVIDPFNGKETINAWDDTNGIMYSIPSDPANSDYQAYLNKDNPVEHFTPNV